MVQGSMRTILAGVFLCTAFAVAGSHAQSRTEARDELTAEDIARGKALTEAGDCASCHTADPTRPFAGGKRIDTPFGGIYAPNLTPDRETGLGAWSDDDFYRALRFGVARDGSRKSNYQPGYELRAKYTVFAEGCRGHIGRRLEERFGLRAAADPHDVPSQRGGSRDRRGDGPARCCSSG